MHTRRLPGAGVLTLALAMGALAHDPNPDGVPEPTAQSLGWLAGDWVSVDDGDEAAPCPFIVSETWAPALHGTMVGVAKTIAGEAGAERIVATKALSIAPRADGLLVLRMRAFDPLLEDRGEARTQMYPLRSWGDDSVIFENDTEDHPRRVMLERTGPDTMRATYVGLNADGKLHAQPTDFRARNASPAADPRTLRVQLFRALLDAGDTDGARTMASADPRRWWERRDGAGTPWDIGPHASGGGSWAAWDAHFKKRTETLFWASSDTGPDAGGSVSVTFRETNDYYRLLERPWATSRATYYFDDDGRITGLLIEALGERDPGRTEEFLAWAREHAPGEIDALMPGGEIDPLGERADHPERFRALLNRWRRDAGLRAIHP